jgi:4-hydroxybenzoate polyprenyltransferase
MMQVSTALKLGRVSNLPTVWTNVLAGVALSSALDPRWAVVLPVGVAASLLYVAGAYLNDAFDARWDAQHHPQRPIPAAEVSARTVFRLGFAMMAAALIVLAVTTSARATKAGLALAALILIYDLRHKGSRFAPMIMALCRVALYVVAASAAGSLTAPPLLVGAALLFLYLTLLATVEAQEAATPKRPRLVGRLVAGISLVDGAQIYALGYPWAALACAGAFALTLGLQRRLAGT